MASSMFDGKSLVGIASSRWEQYGALDGQIIRSAGQTINRAILVFDGAMTIGTAFKT
jgi:hypothetical protein